MDLSAPMLDHARAKPGGHNNIDWREADSVGLPFGDGEFGAAVGAFGINAVPVKHAALAQARRVLKDGGILLFDVWDRIEENPHGEINARIVEGLFPGDEEMRFRIPYEMHDPAQLHELVAEAGFRDVRIVKNAYRGRPRDRAHAGHSARSAARRCRR